MDTQNFYYKIPSQGNGSGFGAIGLQTRKAPQQPQIIRTILLLVFGSLALGSLPIAVAALSSEKQVENQPVPHEAALWSTLGE